MPFSLSKILTVAAGVTASLSLAALPASASSDTAVAAEAAESHVGGTYAWGGNGPNAFDCSGLINWAYAQAGVTDIPRTSSGLYSHTTSITQSELQTGDLVFYSYGSSVSHVAMYVGDGEIVHARNSRMGITKNTLADMHTDPVGYGRVPGASSNSTDVRSRVAAERASLGLPAEPASDQIWAQRIPSSHTFADARTALAAKAA